MVTAVDHTQLKCNEMATCNLHLKYTRQGNNTGEQLRDNKRALSPYNRKCLNKNLLGSFKFNAHDFSNYVNMLKLQLNFSDWVYLYINGDLPGLFSRKQQIVLLLW